MTGLRMPGATHVRASWLRSVAGLGGTESPEASVVVCADQTGALISVPLTGAALVAATESGATEGEPGRWTAVDRYQPTPAMVGLVKARDGHCRFPGCVINARFCDVDHVRPWPLGPTAPPNLMCLCRRHHRTKQRHSWRVQIMPDASVSWTDPFGVESTTLPVDHLGSIDQSQAPPAHRMRDDEPATRPFPSTTAPSDLPGSEHGAAEPARSRMAEEVDHLLQRSLVEFACRPEHLTGHNRRGLRRGGRISTRSVGWAAGPIRCGPFEGWRVDWAVLVPPPPQLTDVTQRADEPPPF